MCRHTCRYAFVCMCVCEGQRRQARTGRRTRDGQGTTWQGQRGQGKTGKAWTRQARTASGHVIAAVYFMSDDKLAGQRGQAGDTKDNQSDFNVSKT